MSSKAWLHVSSLVRISAVCLLSGVVLPSIGCSYFFKEKPKPDTAIRFGVAQNQRSCLGQSLEVVTGYFNRSMARDEAERVIDCAATSIDVFLERTLPLGSTDAYSRDAMQSFIEVYFFENRRMDPETMPLLFRLKASVLGGSDDAISKRELLKIREMIESFRHVAADLRPHEDVYALRTSFAPGVGTARFDSAASALDRAVLRIAEQLKGGDRRPDFSMADVERLLKMSDAYPEMARYLGLAGRLKRLLIRPPEDRIRAAEWPAVLSTVARMYTLYLRYRYFVDGSSLLDEADPEQVRSLIDESLNLLDTGLERRGGEPIGAAEFEAFVDDASALGLLPERIRASSVKGLFWPLMARILRDPSLPPPERGTETKPRAAVAFGREELRRLRSELGNWFAGHQLIHAATGQGTYAHTLGEIKAMFAKRDGDSDAVRRARQELGDIVGRGRRLFHDDQNRLMVVRNRQFAGMTRRDLLFLNMGRSVVRSVVRGYARKPDRAQAYSAIRQDEAQELYLDIRELGIDIGILDSRVYNAGSRSFTEANLFTSVGNGDSLLNVHEGVEFFATVFSGGMAAFQLHEELVAAGCGTTARDFAGFELLGADCVRTFLRSNFQGRFGNLPGMARFARSLDRSRDREEQWSELLMVIENAARTAGFSSAPYEFADLKTLTPVLYYAESLFVRFDRNGNDQLETNEIWSAFPQFRTFIRELGQGQAETEDIQRTIFSFLITFGRPPSIGTSGRFELGSWWVGRRFVSERADRLDILKIISSIPAHGRQTRLAEMDGFFSEAYEALPSVLRAGHEVTARRLTSLMACPEETFGRVTELMRWNADEWLAPAPAEDLVAPKCSGDTQPSCDRVDVPHSRLTSRRFAMRVNATIQADPELRKVCWPLF